jgi:ketosteroid isomerase-like protein
MSQANVELARQAYHAFNRRDLDSLLALVDPDAEATPRLAAVEGVFHGHEGIRRWWNSLLATWPDYQVEVLELRDLGPITLGKIMVGGHSAETGIAVTQMAWHVWRWRREKAVWFAFFPTEAAARAAVITALPRER